MLFDLFTSSNASPVSSSPRYDEDDELLLGSPTTTLLRDDEAVDLTGWRLDIRSNKLAVFAGGLLRSCVIILGSSGEGGSFRTSFTFILANKFVKFIIQFRSYKEVDLIKE